jgi:hypothetical protein
MPTSQQFLVCDSSTLANFKAWAQAISAFFATATWTQSTDTGQVNWSTIASVPGSGAYVYEIWQPNDGLTTFYVKIEYGNTSGTNCPSLRFTISSRTNGAGAPTGFVVGPNKTNTNAYTPASATTQYECNFSGAAGRISVMMWRNGTVGQQQIFAVERSLNSSGAYTSTYATLVTGGNCGANNSFFTQQSLYFGVGAAPLLPNNNNASGGIGVRGPGSAGAFNGSIPIDFAALYVGFWDLPMTSIASASGPDITEGVTFTATLY